MLRNELVAIFMNGYWHAVFDISVTENHPTDDADIAITLIKNHFPITNDCVFTVNGNEIRCMIDTDVIINDGCSLKHSPEVNDVN